MSRDQRYDILFEPLQIGPVTTKNRFYQVPHCTGMGYEHPHSVNRMREINAEGGWGVVCTEYCSIHPSSDDAPYAMCSLWDDGDVRTLANMVERVHQHGALAGVELWYGGFGNGNLLTREPSLAVASMPTRESWVQTQAMTVSDIRRFRRWHREAAIRAQRAGFDIVYVYAGHGYLLSQFLSPVHNRRCDEYGGCFENRVRLIRELLEDTKEAVGDRCAVAIRFAVHNLDDADGITPDSDGLAVVETLAEWPDLWDVNIANFPADARSARFAAEGAQEQYIDFVKQRTTKPVVGVGRFTSPDTMVSQIRRGVLDLIGAARPSIADPFLPQKIEQGRIDDIRECIGCNICIGMNGLGVPLHCTQNPTRGEEWRRDWHPEHIAPLHAHQSVLIVGAGAAGLEAARALGQRGYAVTLAEATTELGGRINQESRLPGLSEWSRVRQYRVQQIQVMSEVAVHCNSELNAAQIIEFAFDHVCIATGAQWRRSGIGRSNPEPIRGWEDTDRVLTVDEIMTGRSLVAGPVVVYDDDHFYIGGLIAEVLRSHGNKVTLVTSAGTASAYTHVTLEQHRIQARLLSLGIDIVVSHRVVAIDGDDAVLACVYSERKTRLPCATLVPVTSREPREALFLALTAAADAVTAAGIQSLLRIGDCAAPGSIEAAVFAGHRYARELKADPNSVKRDRVVW